MAEPPDQAGETGKKRRRPPLSCEQCRKRKIKCNRSYPCNHCTKSGSEPCTYAPTHTPKSRRRRVSITSPLRSDTPASLRPPGGVRPTATATPMHTPDSDIFHRAGPRQPLRSSIAASPAVSSSHEPAPGANPSRHSTNYAASGSRVEASHSGHPTQENRASELSLTTKGSISKSRYIGQSNWMNIAASFPVELAMLKSEENAQGELFQTLDQCKMICRKIKTSRLQTLSPRNLGKEVLSRELSDELVSAYLRTFEGVFRIVHVPTFRREYANYWENPAEASETFVILLQLCMALGSSLQDDAASLKPTVMRWISEAQMWLVLPPEKGRMNLSGIQIMCLLSLAKMTCGLSADLTWIMAGSLIRTAMYMGLHRDPSQLGEMTVYQAEMRRRLWATVLELNLQYALEAGGLPLISCDDYDTLPPADLDDGKLDESIDDVSKRFARSSAATQMSVPVEVFKSFPTRLKLVQCVNNFHSNLDYGETLRLDSELTKACRSFTQTIGSLKRQGNGTAALPESEQAGLITDLHISLAEVTLYRCFHALHFPILFTSFEDPRFYFSRKMCLDGALKIADLWRFPRPRARNNGPQSDFDRLTIHGSGMFKNVAVQAVCIIALEVIHNKSDQPSGLGYLPTVGNSDLRGCLDEALGWTVDRLRAGELTGSKGHCFLSACIAHIEALDQGLDKAATTALLVQRTTEAAKAHLALLKNIARDSGITDTGAQGHEEDSTTTDGTLEAIIAGWDGGWAWDEGDDWMWGGAWSQLNAPMPLEDVNDFFATPVGYPR